MARQGRVRHGLAWRGSARQGEAGILFEAGSGLVWLGQVWFGKAGQGIIQGMVRRGAVWFGEARSGLARSGGAGRGMAGIFS